MSRKLPSMILCLYISFYCYPQEQTFSVELAINHDPSIEPGHSYMQSPLSLPKNGNTYVIAHRGAHDSLPENSLAAYQKAIDLGCVFVEIDVRTTKDGHFVSIHNSTIDAYVNNGTGKVREYTLAQLRDFDIGEKYGVKWRNTKIPTFLEIIELCQGKIGVYLDLKEADPKALIPIIKKYDMEQSVVWYVPGNEKQTIMDIKRECPECPVMPDPGKKKNIDRTISLYRPEFMASDIDHISRSFVKKLHLNQIKVFVDEAEENPNKWYKEWQMLLDWGVDGIQTDKPEVLIHFLKNRKAPN